LRQQFLFLRSRFGMENRSSAKQWPAVVAKRGMQNQLLCLKFRPQSDGYLIPVDIFVVGTISSRRRALRNRRI
jgi:hypothetical protein